MKMKEWEVLGTETVLDNRYLRVRKDKVKISDRITLDDFYIWDRGDMIIIIPVTEDDEFVFVRQYKHGIKSEIIEFPKGCREEGETRREAAIRELEEETGYKADSVEEFMTLNDELNKVDGDNISYVAKGLHALADPKKDELEDIELLKVGFEDAVKMVMGGKIVDANTISLIFIYLKSTGKTI